MSAVSPARDDQATPFASPEELAAALARGEMVVLVDNPDRENEGDITLAAEFVSPEAINFMISHARGQVCLAITEELATRLELPLQPQRNLPANQARFTISIEAAKGVGTGVSPKDRAHTILTAIREGATAHDIATPGHVFPLIAAKGGLSERVGHTEASIALCEMAKLTKAAVICEVIAENGEMARLPELQVFCKKHGLKLGRIDTLKTHLQGQ
jgi:3,4-dihydroxy 2-butanone 4-phosphate synthase/GTP cyclohydrolase II